MVKLVMRICVTLLMALNTVTAAQNRKLIVRHSPGDSLSENITEAELLHIPELSAMIGEAKGKLSVNHILEAAMRPKGYEKTDVNEGDIILMANGKKLNGMSDLKELYNTASTGSTVKLGIKRNDEMMIASFIKADPKAMPRMRMMISNGDVGDFLGIPGIGLRFSSEGSNVIVKEVLPNAADELPNVDVKEGDRITKLNGSPVKSFSEFAKTYEKIHAGSHVELTITRGEKSSTASFVKPDDNGRVIIRKQSK